MKNIKTTVGKDNNEACIWIEDGSHVYQMFSDGVIYNNTNSDDIPQWIFEIRDFVLRNIKN